MKDVQPYVNFSIQLTYGTGTGSSAKLQASNDYNPDTGIGNFTDVEGSEQTLDNLGGVHMWNVTNSHYAYLQVAVSGDAVDNEVTFAGNDILARGR